LPALISTGFIVTLFAGALSGTAAEDDRATVARLDVEYQAAVKHNDAAAMDRILHPEFTLVLGDGRTVSRTDLIEEARSRRTTYEQQDEASGSQTVRVWGDTAVVTAKLWIKGTREGAAFDRTLWFSDTYVRTPGGWKYAFGQASLALPKTDLPGLKPRPTSAQ